MREPVRTSGHRRLRASQLVGLMLMALVLAVQAVQGDGDTVAWRQTWWDGLHRMMPRDRGDPAVSPAVVVAVDEESMASIQQWPWPRDELARIVEAAHRHGAAALAFDIILVQPDAQSPPAQAQRYQRSGQDADGLAAQLEGLEDTDAALARAINRAAYPDPGMPPMPVVLPLTGVPEYEGLDRSAECNLTPPLIVMDPPSMGLGKGFPAADLPLLLLREAGARLAAINFTAGDDFVIRRVKAVQRICDKPFLLLGLEALAGARQGFFTTVRNHGHSLEIFLDDPSGSETVRFPAERDGSFWLHFGPVGVEKEGGGRELRRYISAHDMLSPDFDGSRIAGKIVLVAVIDLGRVDERRSPLGNIIYGVEAHMQMIEQIVDGHYLRRPWYLFLIETLVLALSCLAIVTVVPHGRPAQAVFTIAVGTTGLLVLSAAAFPAGLLIDAASVVLGTAIVATGVISVTLIERDRERLRSEIELQSERADRAVLQGELDAAARIQMALLPPARFEQPGAIDLACHIDPARTVGGDFYDHVLVDDRHLFFLVADVSGKGADASQFMLLSKTLWKSVALRTKAPLEQIQIEANAEITRENVATMFVTGLCGLLDLETGVLSFSSAGHDLPFLFSDTARPCQLDASSGPPAGLTEDMDFPVGTVGLQPGQRICVFTDGITEAMDAQGQVFGLDRLEQALADAPPGLSSAAMVEHVVATVRWFTGDAEQSDDLTLMIITVPEG